MAQDQRHMVLALKKLLYPHVFNQMGGRQDHLLPWGFSPCAYEVSVTDHLPEKPQERTGQKGFHGQGCCPTRKAAQNGASG